MDSSRATTEAVGSSKASSAAEPALRQVRLPAKPFASMVQMVTPAVGRRSSALPQQALADWNAGPERKPHSVADSMVGVRTDAELRRELSSSRDKTVSSCRH